MSVKFFHAQSISVTNTSDLGSCNGSAIFLDSAFYDTWTWIYLEDNYIIANGYTGIFDLCMGDYTLIATSNGVNSSF